MSQYDICINDAVLHVLSHFNLPFVIESIFVVALQKTDNFCRYFTATQRTLIRLQCGKLWVREHAIQHVLCLYNIVIQSELKSIIGVKVRSWRNCGAG